MLEICGTGKVYGIMKNLSTLEEESKWKRKFVMSSRNEVRGRVLMAFCLTRSVVLRARRFLSSSKTQTTKYLQISGGEVFH